MPDFAVGMGINMNATDRVSGVLNKLDRGTAKFGNTAKKAFEKGSKAAGRYENVVGGILKAGAITKAAALIKTGLGAVGTEFVGFDDAIVSASAKFKGLNLTTEAGKKKMDELRKSARKTGADTQFSAGEAAQGLDFWAMAGANADQAMAALPGTVDLATVANIDLGRATDIASDSLGAFGLMTENSEQLSKNLSRQNDVMALTMSRANLNAEDMFETIKKGGPTLTAAGQRLETFSAFAGIMANSSLKGSEAGVSMKNMVLKLAAPSKEAQAELARLGVTTEDADGNFRDIVDVLEDVERGLDGMGTAQRTAALANIFGARTVTGINILLEAGTDKIRAFRAELDSGTGASKRMAAVMRRSLGNRLKAIKSAAVEAGFKIFEAFNKQGSGAIATFTAWLRTVDLEPLIRWLRIGVSLFTGLLNVINFLSPAFAPLISLMAAYLVVTKGVIAFNAIKHFLFLTKAISAAAKAQTMLNFVLSANPIGVVITLVAGLIFYIMRLVKVWDKTKGFFGNIGAAFRSFFGGKGDDKKSPEAVAEAEGQRIAGPAEETRRAPNENQVNAELLKTSFAGRLDISGAPEGSEFTDKSPGAPPINVEFLGENP